MTSNDDVSSNSVIDWLDFYKVPWLRINETDKITVKSINLGNSKINIQLWINDTVLDLSSITFFWYRRGYFNWIPQHHITENQELNSGLTNYVNMETKKTFDFIYYYLNSLKHISGYEEALNKKLEYLNIAVDAGLIVPDTIICNNKAELEHFFLHHRCRIATKSIYEGYYQETKDKLITSRTYLVDNIATLPDKFSDSLFQEYIEKQFEIRIFFVRNQIYAMAIFSQENEKTKIDFRQYDHQRPNRTVPFTLPERIKIKLIKFIKNTGLSTGSVDMILTKGNNYVFLEVNPVGQFGMMSYPCNYNLERILAQLMSTYETTN
jgi:ATP-GRASP peptide maturase of grasp-with-spasm system